MSPTYTDPYRKYDAMSEKTGLYPVALLEFDEASVDLADLIAQRWDDGQWHGDSCGCEDDRCIGYHHDEREDCGCRPATIRTYLRSKQAEEAGAEVWAAYVAARAADDTEALDRARTDAEAWVNEYHRGATSWSLDEVVDGRRGISTTNRYNGRHWIMYDPERAPGTPRPLAY